MKIKRFHCVYEVAGCSEAINSADQLKTMIERIVSAINMKIVAGPLIAEGNPEEPGLTAIVVIDFSHVSIHAFSKHMEAQLDVFSVKPFDTQKVKEIILECIGTNASTVSEKKVWWGQ